MVLPDPKQSRVVLIGASRFTDPTLADLPAVRNNLADLAACLRDRELWGLPKANCVLVTDPMTPDDLLDPVHTAAEAAEDTLLVYYAGHGQIDAETGELLLAITKSKAGRSHTSVPYHYLRRDVNGARARRRVVILDCCYSGKAIGGMADPSTVVADAANAAGTYVLASAPPNKQALSPPGERHTAFTGELIELLKSGLPDGGELLDLDSIYRHIYFAMRDKSRPEPQKRAGNTAGNLGLVRNMGWRSPQTPAGWAETKAASTQTSRIHRDELLRERIKEPVREAEPGHQLDSPSSFWIALAEAAKSNGLNRDAWFWRAKELAERAGIKDFILESTVDSWKDSRGRWNDEAWSDGFVFFVQAAAGTDEEDWRPWQIRWEQLRDQTVSAATLTLEKRAKPEDGASSVLQEGRLDNRYQLGRLISRSERATVRIAHDMSLRRMVVVKFLMYPGDREARESALRAARVAATLDHLGVVRVYDISESAPAPYIVMEHVDGQPLSEIIATQDWMTPRQATEIVADVCGALNYCHRRGVAHGAIELGNVMLARDRTVKLINVGFGAGPVGDIYSVGELLHTLIKGSPVPADGVPSTLNDIIAKAQQGDHGYTHIAELRADLDRYLSKA